MTRQKKTNQNDIEKINKEIAFKKQCIFYTQKYIGDSDTKLDQMMKKQLERLKKDLDRLEKELKTLQKPVPKRRNKK